MLYLNSETGAKPSFKETAPQSISNLLFNTQKTIMRDGQCSWFCQPYLKIRVLWAILAPGNSDDTDSRLQDIAKKIFMK